MQIIKTILAQILIAFFFSQTKTNESDTIIKSECSVSRALESETEVVGAVPVCVCV